MFSLITCAKIHQLEVIGYLVFGLGVFLMFSDPYAVKTGEGGNAFWGRLIPFLGAGAGALLGYLNSNKDGQIHPVIRLAHYFFYGIIFQLIFFPLFLTNDKFYSFDSKYGCFGWMSTWENIFMVLGIVSPITGVLGNLGYFMAFNYFPMQIVAATILLEPFVGQLCGILLGQDEIPGFRTALGLCVNTAGFVIASYGASLKQNEAINKIMDHNLSCKY